MDIMKMTKEDFNEVPDYSESQEIQKFSSVVIVPDEEMHDSGFRCMKYVFCIGNEPICKIDMGSDVLHLDGIDGRGDWIDLDNIEIPITIKPKSWKIDCLPCGYLRLYAHKHLYIKECFGSDLDLYCKD